MPSEEALTDAGTPSPRRFPLAMLTACCGLLAGLLAAWGGEVTVQALHREPEYPAGLANLTSSQRAIARAIVRFETKRDAQTEQAAAAYGLLGLALGVALGLAGGLAAGSLRTGLVAAAGGGVFGALLGAGLSLATVPLFFEYFDTPTALPLLLLTHAVIFVGVASAAGAGLGWACGDRKVVRRCALGAIVGALVATFAVEVINLVVFGIMRMFEPVPATTMPRSVVHLGVAFGAALGAGRALRKSLKGHPPQ